MLVRFRFTIILLILNLIAVGLLWLINSQQEENQVLLQDWDIPLFANTATFLSLQGKLLENQRIFQKEGKQWWIKKPVFWRANQHAVHQILNQIKFLEVEVRFSLEEMRQVGKDLSEYGLDKPTFSIVFGDPSNSIELSFGKLSEVGNRIYILSPDKKQILVVKQDLVKSLIMPLADLIESNIFVEPIFSVEELTVEKGQDQLQRIRLERRDRSWKFSIPFEDQVDSEKIKYFFNQLYALKLQDFVFNEETESIQASFEDPNLRIAVGSEDKQEILLVGKEVVAPDYPDGTYFYAKRQDLDEIFVISDQVFSLVADIENRLRCNLLIDFDEKALQRIVVENEGNQITIQKQQSNLQEQTNQWHLMENLKDQGIVVEAVDHNVLNNKVAYLKKLSIDSFITDTPSPKQLEQFGLKDSLQRITLHGDAMNTSIILGTTIPGENLVYVKRNDSDSIFSVDDAILFKFTTDRLHYRDRHLLKLSLDDTLSAFTIRNYVDKTVKFQIKKNSIQTWDDFFENYTTKAEIEDLKTILQYGRNFKVGSYLRNPVDQKGFGMGDLLHPWKFLLEYSIKLSSGQLYTQTYWLTERIGGMLQAGAYPEKDQVFTLTQEFLDALFPFIFERKPISVEEALQVPQNNP